MSRLIHSSSLDKFTAAFADWESSNSSIYRAVAFMDDGHLYTHGKVFKMALNGTDALTAFSRSNLDLSITVSGVSKSLKLPTLGTSTSDALVIKNPGDSDGNNTVKSYTVNHVVPSTLFTSSSPGDVSISLLQKVSGVNNRANSVSYTFNKYGHLISSAKNATEVPLYNVRMDPSISDTNAEYCVPFAPWGTPYEGVLYESRSVTINTTTKALSAPSFIEGGTPLSDKYASKDVIAANDAMVFKGTLGTGGTVTTLPTDYKIGWTYRVVTAGTYAGQNCEVGDLIIAIKDYAESTVSNTDWTVAQTNIDGAVTHGTNNLTANTLVIASGGSSISSLANASPGWVLTMGNSQGVNHPMWAQPTYRAIIGDSFKISYELDYLNLATTGNIQLQYDESENTLTFDVPQETFGSLLFRNLNDSSFNQSYAPVLTDTTLEAIGGLRFSYDATNGKIQLGHSNSITSKTTAALGKIKYDAYGHITGFEEVSSLKNPYAFNVRIGDVNASYTGESAKSIIVKAGNNVTFTYNDAEITPTTVTVNALNTWRPVNAWKLSEMANSGDTIDNVLAGSTGTTALQFSSSFAYDDTTSQLDIVWTEIDVNGNVTYVL